MSDIKRTLKDEAEAARVLLANVRDVLGDDEDAIHDAVEGETGLLEAIWSAVDRLAEIEAHDEALELMMKSLASRRDRFQNQAEQIRAALLVAMSMAELKKLELPQATISRKPTPAKALIVDEAAIPARFWKPSDPKLDKKSVLDALKAGEAVPGTSLSNGGETIAIRRG